MSHYSHETSVVFTKASVLYVSGEIWDIETEITKKGAECTQNQQVERERLTRKLGQLQAEEEEYDNKKLGYFNCESGSNANNNS